MENGIKACGSRERIWPKIDCVVVELVTRIHEANLERNLCVYQCDAQLDT